MSNKMDKKLEKQLWSVADSLRGNISSENYMHIVIGLMFIKHMSDKYNEAIKNFKTVIGFEPTDEDKQDKILLSKLGVSFVIPEKASWDYISKFAASLEIGQKIDEAFELIENTNRELKGLFDKNYNREELDQKKLGQVVSEFSNIDLKKFGEDIIGRTYEFFLGQFFLKQGQKGGEFYTPDSIVKLMVNLINPLSGKIYDPAAGTGGMLVQARQHIIDLKGDPDDLVAFGQEYQNKTWKLSRINLLLHGFPNQNIKLGHKSANTFTEDLHRNEKYDYILANPPFNQKKWGLESLMDDERWEWGLPPKNNANYAWLSLMIHKLNEKGIGATVLANGSLSGSGKDEIKLRKAWLESNIIEAIITLPDKLFYTTGIPASIWIFNKNKSHNKILMVNASEFEGQMESKKLRVLTHEEIGKIVNTYKSSRTNDIDEIGYSKSVDYEEIKENDFSFVPGRYVGVVEEKVDVEKLKSDIKEAQFELSKLFDEFHELIPKVKNSIKKALDSK